MEIVSEDGNTGFRFLHLSEILVNPGDKNFTRTGYRAIGSLTVEQSVRMALTGEPEPTYT